MKTGRARSPLEGLPLLHSLCLLFNNHLKLSKLTASVVMKRLIMKSVIITIALIKQLNNQLKRNLKDVPRRQLYDDLG